MYHSKLSTFFKQQNYATTHIAINLRYSYS